MANFEDVTGRRFEKLVVIKRIENKDNRPYFLCQCDCGKTTEVSTQNLKGGNVRSCGCLKKSESIKNMIGKVFSRITVISDAGLIGNKSKIQAFNCECSCGNKKIIRGSDLRSGSTTSCGCWRNEKALENISGVNNTLKDPKTANAMKVYIGNYSDGDLTFEQFMDLSQGNCVYCNAPPGNNYNTFKTTKNSAQSSIENGNFNYNGLDRVNANFPHNFENLVTACAICNVAKSDMSFDEFKNWIIESYNYIYLNLNIVSNGPYRYLKLLATINIDKSEYNRKQHPAISSARVMFKNYNDGNLIFEKFLELTQFNCVYCGVKPSNKFNAYIIRSDSSEYARINGDFIYNGLDRINSSLNHDIENIVPCCQKCNWAKGNKSVEDYKNWIIKVYSHLFKSSQI